MILVAHTCKGSIITARSLCSICLKPPLSACVCSFSLHFYRLTSYSIEYLSVVFMDWYSKSEHTSSFLVQAANRKAASVCSTGSAVQIDSGKTECVASRWCLGLIRAFWTVFLSAEVIKSTFESWELLLMPLSLMLSQENDLPFFFFSYPSFPWLMHLALFLSCFAVISQVVPCQILPQIYSLFLLYH